MYVYSDDPSSTLYVYFTHRGCQQFINVFVVLSFSPKLTCVLLVVVVFLFLFLFFTENCLYMHLCSQVFLCWSVKVKLVVCLVLFLVHTYYTVHCQQNIWFVCFRIFVCALWRAKWFELHFRWYHIIVIVWNSYKSLHDKFFGKCLQDRIKMCFINRLWTEDTAIEQCEK